MRIEHVNLASVFCLVVILLLICPGYTFAQSYEDLSRSGVVIERVDKGSALETGGVLPGDVLLSWKRHSLGDPITEKTSETCYATESLEAALFPPGPTKHSGTILTFSDWMLLKDEYAPRFPVQLRILRGGKVLLLHIPQGAWGALARPNFDDTAYSQLVLARLLSQISETAGVVGFETLAQEAEQRGDLDSYCWLKMQIGHVWVRAGAWSEAHKSFVAGMSVSDPICKVIMEWNLAEAYKRQTRYREAEEALRNAVAIAQQAWGKSLMLTRSQSAVIKLGTELGRVSEQQGLVLEMFNIEKEIAPFSLDMAGTIGDLGLIAERKGDLDTAWRYYEESRRIQEHLAPLTDDMVAILNDMGVLELERGALTAAETYFLKAVKISDTLGKDSLIKAIALINLGNLADERGDMDLAEHYYRRSEGPVKRLAGNGPLQVRLLANLSALYFKRGDLDQAEVNLGKAFDIQVKTGLTELDQAVLLENRGSLAFEKRDLDRAEALATAARSLQEKEPTKGLELAGTLSLLGQISQRRGRWKDAEGYFDKSLLLREKIAPDSLSVAIGLRDLGDLRRAEGKLEEAVLHYQRAAAIQGRLATGTITRSATLHSLGETLLQMGQIDPAERFLTAAVDDLEEQADRLGGANDTEEAFRYQHGNYYSHLLTVLLKRNKSSEAFSILERQRARSFLKILAERDLVLESEIPEATRKARQKLNVQYDELQNQFMTLDTLGRSAEALALMAKLTTIRNERAQIIQDLRESSPRFAALRYAKPLNLSEFLGSLDSGTVALSYGVSEDRTDIFVVTPDGSLHTETIPISEPDLRAEVLSFTKLILETKGSLAPPRKANMQLAGRQLYRKILGPVEQWIESGSRLLIIPDGPLHKLPWGSLIRDSAGAGGTTNRNWQYLAEWKPIHIVLSATVYSGLLRTRAARPSSDSDPSLAAFGNPDPSKTLDTAENMTDFRLRSAIERGFRFEPLPATQVEVENIARLYPSNSTIYLGAKATEENAKALSRSTRIVHFATHATLDERSPLDSAVVLSIPDKFEEGKDNGLLQAWEIFEQVRLDADLVVLSACESGLGKEMGGEGLIGLTRAFQYAGARSVMASLWKISDRTTAELMVRFYKHFKEGLPKDEALRAAQMELIRGPIQVKNEKGEVEEIDASAPYYWAAFQIYGDWQ